MKTSINNLIIYFGLTLALTTTLFSTTGCAQWWFTSEGRTTAHQPDPLSNWIFRPFPGWEAPPYGHNTNHLDEAIIDDYQNFISTNKLFLNGAITGFYEDGTGQRAIEFEAFPPSEYASWHYVLIYTKENKRVKEMQYGRVRRQS